MHLHHANLLTLLCQVIHDLLHRLTDGAHGDDNPLGIRCAVIIEELVVSAGQGIDGIHLCLNNIRQSVVGRVAGLSALEEGVRILQCGADGRVLGVEGMILKAFDHIPIHNLCQIVIVQHINLLNLMAGAEPIKEMHKRDRPFDGAEMCHRAEVHAFLHTGGGQLRKTGLPACHSVGMVTEDRDGMGCKGSCRNMHDARQHRPCNTVHGGNHQHQALGSRVGGGERSCLQRTVHGTASAGFTLQLHQLNRLAEQILFAVGSPTVHMVGHGARGRYGIDCGNFGKGIACVRRCLIAVHCFFDEHNGIILLYQYYLPSPSGNIRHKNR